MSRVESDKKAENKEEKWKKSFLDEKNGKEGNKSIFRQRH